MTEVRRGHCLLGCGETRPALVGFDRWTPREGSFAYERCASCGLLQIAERPRRDELAALYPDDYAPHAAAPRTRDRNLVNRLAIRGFYSKESLAAPKLVRSIFGLLSNRILRDVEPPRGECRLLDWGSGSGAALDLYRRLGWEVTGVELDARAARRSRAAGFEVFESTLAEAPHGERRFDLVLGSHVVEHVLDPVADLRRAGELLAPGGSLVLVTPNAASGAARRFGPSWFALDAPRHLQLFTPEAMRRLAALAGLHVRSLSTRPDPAVAAASRSIRDLQGDRLPDDPAERTARIAAWRAEPPPSRAELRLRNLTSPFSSGDETRTELVHRRGDVVSYLSFFRRERRKKGQIGHYVPSKGQVREKPS